MEQTCKNFVPFIRTFWIYLAIDIFQLQILLLSCNPFAIRIFFSQKQSVRSELGEERLTLAFGISMAGKCYHSPIVYFNCGWAGILILGYEAAKALRHVNIRSYRYFLV